MPTVYSCSSCNYKVSLGWFHYHDFSSGYGSETLLVCNVCGTPHTIHIALPASIQDEMHKTANVIIDDIGSKPYEVRRILRESTGCNRPQANIVLESLPGIFVSGLSHSGAQKIIKNLIRVGAIGHIEITHEIQYQKDSLFALISRDENTWHPCTIVGNRDNLTGHFELEEQICAFCRTKGTLVAELASSDGDICICPSCKKSTLTVVSTWRT